MKKLLIAFSMLLILWISPWRATAQIKTEGHSGSADQPAMADELIERSAELLESDQDFSELADDLSHLALNPVNLNKADPDDLQRIPFLTPGQRENLLMYLLTYGEVLSVFELQSVPGFDSSVVQLISPYVMIEPPSRIPKLNPANLVRYGHHDIILRVSQSFPAASGYQTTDSLEMVNTDAFYQGSPQRYYFRYTYGWYDKIRIGIAGEKDPGEQFFSGGQKAGMDFYAGYISLGNMGILKNLIVGNFKVAFGQGLTMGAGGSLGSGPGFPTQFNPSTGIRPSVGMNESTYLRGLATTVKIRRTEISGFISRHPRDGTISVTDTGQMTGEVGTLSGSGYHRNDKELAKKNAFTELICGGNINFSMAPNQQFGFKTGFTAVYCSYSAALSSEVSQYTRFNFRGRQNINTGIDFQIRWHGIYLFGELSRSQNNGLAGIAGMNFSPDQSVNLTIICRNYQPMYQNLFSAAFSQNSLNANEKGIYFGITSALHAKINLSGYLDLFRFPWLKYRVDTPASGHESGIFITLQAASKLSVTLRYYNKNSRINETLGSNLFMHKLADNVTRGYRMGLEWNAAKGILLKTRLEARESGLAGAKRSIGCFLYQEAQINIASILERITFRFAIFDIPDYASRIYVYEPEVLYGYSVPAYQGKGVRSCLVLKFGLNRRVDCWLRGGITYYTDRNEVGTGPDLTNGNVRGEITGQLLVKL